MNQHSIHEAHEHRHGPDCGHRTITHEGHTDYLHDGHLHHPHEGHVDEHTLEVGGMNPSTCTSGHTCSSHDTGHVHGRTCGHETMPHGDHIDYLVEGHLHHVHAGHCDDHGRVVVG